MTAATSPPGRSGPALALILSGYLALATALSFAIPLGEAPDEVSHYAYLSELRFRGQLPAAQGAAIGEAHQPPLYYLLVVGATAWLPDGERPILANPAFDLKSGVAANLLLHPRAETWPFTNGAAIWHAWRLVSVLLGLVTVAATYLLARTLVPGDRRLAVLAASLLAFLPSFLFISAVVNNDNLVIALSTLALFQWARMIARPPTAKDAAMLGLLLGLAAMAKMPGLLLWPVVGVGVLWQMKDPRSRRAWLSASVIALVAGLAIMAPWLIYTTVVFSDPLAWSRFMQVTPRPRDFVPADALGYLGSMATSLAGRFGGASHLRLPDGLYVGVAAFALAAVLGLVRPGRGGDGPVLSTPARRALAVCLTFAALLAAAHFRIMMFILGMDQARHVFSGLPGIAVAAAIGFRRLTARAPAALLAATIVMPVAAVVALLTVSSAYSPRTVAGPSLSAPPVADFAGQVRLVQATVSGTAVQAGETITVHTIWQAVSEPASACYLQLRLSRPGAENDPVTTADGVPDDGRVTTDRWPVGVTYQSDHALRVPEGAAPGAYELRLGLHPVNSWAWLKATGQDSVVVGLIQVGAPPSPPKP